MRCVKIAFSNCYPGFNPKDLGTPFTHNRYLKASNINIVVSDSNPEIIFNGCFGDFLFASAHEDGNVIKVLVITEPISPDSILFDCCITFDPSDFEGRNCYYPFFLFSVNHTINTPSSRESEEILKNKNPFCDFIYHHDGYEISRKHYFNLLNSYRKVEAAGIYLNNQNQGKVLDYWEKGLIQNKCNFSICIQSVSLENFINEKIIHSLCANTIPIFYGPKSAKTVFNPKRIIFIQDYKGDDDLLDEIKRIDKNDDLFCSIISQPIFLQDSYVERTLDNAEKFVFEIISGIKKKRTIYAFKTKEIKERLVSLKNNKKERGGFKKSNGVYKKTPLKKDMLKMSKNVFRSGTFNCYDLFFTPVVIKTIFLFHTIFSVSSFKRSCL